MQRSALDWLGVVSCLGERVCSRFCEPWLNSLLGIPPELMWRKVMRGTGFPLFARADRSGRSFEQGVRRPTSLAQVTVKAALFQNQQFYHFLQNLNCTEPIFDLAQEIIFQEPPLHIVSECSGPPEIFAKFGIPAWWRISHSHSTVLLKLAASQGQRTLQREARLRAANDLRFNFSFFVHHQQSKYGHLTFWFENLCSLRQRLLT